MRMWCAPGVRPGRGKGPTGRWQRAAPVTRTVVAGICLTASVPLLESARRALDSLLASRAVHQSQPGRALPGWTSIAAASCPS